METEQVLWPVGSKLQISIEGTEMLEPYVVKEVIYEQNYMIVENRKNVRYSVSGGGGYRGGTVIGMWPPDTRKKYVVGDVVYLCSGSTKRTAVVVSVTHRELYSYYCVVETDSGHMSPVDIYDEEGGWDTLEPAPIKEVLKRGFFVIHNGKPHIINSGPDVDGNYLLEPILQGEHKAFVKTNEVKPDPTRFIIDASKI